MCWCNNYNHEKTSLFLLFYFNFTETVENYGQWIRKFCTYTFASKGLMHLCLRTLRRSGLSQIFEGHGRCVPSQLQLPTAE